MATATVIGPEPSSAETESQADARVYRCDCGQALRVSGVGRHRVYFEQGEGGLEEPVTNRVCPSCQRGLPGKNPQ